MTGKPFVDIIILNWNSERDTAECIRSVEAQSFGDYRVIIVDNGSDDGSGERLRARFPRCEVLRSEVNLGFAGGCNLGIRHALAQERADYFLLLNNDTIVAPEMLELMVREGAMDERRGIIAAVNYYYARPATVHMAAHRFFWWRGMQGIIKDVASACAEVQSVSGSCMLIRKDVIGKIGFFDERYFAYYEDADLCLRARRSGFKVIVVRDAKVWHKIATVLGKGTPREYYIYTRNQPLFMLKNAPRFFLPNYFLVYGAKVLVRIFYFFCTARREKATAILRGWEDFMNGNFGRGRLFE
ncbi:MAG: glycosyltransferase family 2 protein [Candidatus Omnitrophota bacterium]